MRSSDHGTAHRSRSDRGLVSRAAASRAPVPELTTIHASIVEQTNDAIFTCSLDGTLTTWNAAATRILGFRAGEIIGRPGRLLLPRGHDDEFRELLVRLRRGEVVPSFEAHRRRKDGRNVCLSLTVSPLRDAAGRLIGASMIARDITEQRRVREALECRGRELEDLFDEATIGLLLTTRSGRVLEVNRALLDILECKPEDCVGHPWAEFHPDRAKLGGLIRRLARRETLSNYQTALRARGGGLKEVLVDANAFWEQGKVAHLRWFIRDSTRRKQLEREVLATSERERRVFARELHDSLGQQLSGIAYLGNVLRERLRERALPEAADAQRIARLLRRALEETRRVSRGLSPVRPEPEGLDTALSELVAQTRNVFGIGCRLRRAKPVLVTDSEAATHLYRIAQEAVSNAIRHGQARRITIGLSQRRGQVTLSVTDNGRGIGVLSPRRKGMGLRVMQYRAGLLQATVSVTRRPEGGTEVRCVAPAGRLKPPKSAR
jgi:PAS domain S-box-containing protein